MQGFGTMLVRACIILPRLQRGKYYYFLTKSSMLSARYVGWIGNIPDD